MLCCVSETLRWISGQGHLAQWASAQTSAIVMALYGDALINYLLTEHSMCGALVSIALHVCPTSTQLQNIQAFVALTHLALTRVSPYRDNINSFFSSFHAIRKLHNHLNPHQN